MNTPTDPRAVARRVKDNMALIEGVDADVGQRLLAESQLILDAPFLAAEVVRLSELIGYVEQEKADNISKLIIQTERAEAAEQRAESLQAELTGPDGLLSIAVKRCDRMIERGESAEAKLATLSQLVEAVVSGYENYIVAEPQSRDEEYAGINLDKSIFEYRAAFPKPNP